MPDISSPIEYFNESINVARQNISQVVEHGLSADQAIEVARIQVEIAKACAVLSVAQAIREGNAWGNAIRYGMTEVAEAIKNHA